MTKAMKTTIIAAVLAIGLNTAPAYSQTGTNSALQQQQMSGKMMGCKMMNGKSKMKGSHNMLGGQSGKSTMGCNGMMGGMMMNQMSAEQRQEFMDQTVELRKQMMAKRFDYMEAMRKKDIDVGELAAIEKEMLELRGKILAKIPKK